MAVKDINIFENTFQLFESPYQKAAIGCPAISMIQFVGIHSTLLSRPMPCLVHCWSCNLKLTHVNQSINQSVNQNLYSAPSRYLLRGAPDSGQAEKNSLEKVLELRTGKFGRCLRSIGSPVQVAGPTTEKEQVCIVAYRANGITKLP